MKITTNIRDENYNKHLGWKLQQISGMKITTNIWDENYNKHPGWKYYTHINDSLTVPAAAHNVIVLQCKVN